MGVLSMPRPPSASAAAPVPEQIRRAAFQFLTALALPACALTTAAHFSTTPAFLAMFSPFRVQYAALLFAYALASLTVLRRPRWAPVFVLFAGFNLVVIARSLATSEPPSAPAAALFPTAHAAPTAPTALTIAGDEASAAAPVPRLKILLANVLTSNPDRSGLLAWIQTERPDVVALMEINRRWEKQLAAIATEFPHRLVHSREDNFGIALYSRPPAQAVLREDLGDVPSIDATLDLAAGRRLRLLVTHPVPPYPAYMVRERDQHLAEIGRWLDATGAEPAVAIGDFNATPWCPPLRRLAARHQLLTTAGGRWLPPATWPTNLPHFAIPLDQAIRNHAVRGVEFRRGPTIGSDHFPVLLVVDLLPAKP